MFTYNCIFSISYFCIVLICIWGKTKRSDNIWGIICSSSKDFLYKNSNGRGERILLNFYIFVKEWIYQIKEVNWSWNASKNSNWKRCK